MKYYYDDPLAAAWMAKHYGMKFKEFSDSYTIEAITWDTRTPSEESKRYYIHPDSLPLLEQLSNDVIKWTVDSGQLGNQTYVEAIADVRLSLNLKQRVGDGIVSWCIIERDNKPFFWPKREES